MLILILTITLLQGWLGLALPYCQEENAVFSATITSVSPSCHHTSTTCCDHTQQNLSTPNSTEIHLDCVHCLHLHLQTSMMLCSVIALIASAFLRRRRFSFSVIHFRSHIPKRLHRPPHTLFSHT